MIISAIAASTVAPRIAMNHLVRKNCVVWFSDAIVENVIDCFTIYLRANEYEQASIVKGRSSMIRNFRIAILIAATAAANLGSADVIYLRGGGKQQGIITLDRSDLPTVSIRTSGGEIAIPRSKIDHVDMETKAQSYARIGDQYLDAKNYTEAVNAYQSALQYEKDNADIQARLKEAQTGLEALAEADKQVRDDKIGAQLEVARGLLKDKKFEEALQTVRAADPADDSAVMADVRKAYSEVYLQWGMDRLDRQDFPGAAEKLQMALKFSPNDEKIKQQLVRVWQGDPTKVKEIAAFYKDSTAPADQLKLAEAYFKMKNYEAALPIYLKYVNDPNLSSQVMVDRIRLMFDMLHRMYAERGEFEKAIAVYKQFLDFSPKEDQTPLARYQYMLQRSKTDVNNPDARADLAEFAEQHGLVETAKREYKNILAISPKNAKAFAGLKRFADSDLKDATDFFAEAQYLLALQKANSLITDYPEFPEVVRQAQQLQTKAQLEQQKVARSQQQQAEALALRGDDYYNQALAYISSYTSTEVSRTQQVFSPKIEATKYLERALFSWRTALAIDPSLGDPTRYDLYRKIADAYAKYVVLANPLPPRLPTRDSSRLQRGESGPGSR
jgi:tetratricopeptide (TPR) repeat protein